MYTPDFLLLNKNCILILPIANINSIADASSGERIDKGSWFRRARGGIRFARFVLPQDGRHDNE
jgi:hypothetical protein